MKETKQDDWNAADKTTERLLERKETKKDFKIALALVTAFVALALVCFLVGSVTGF